MQRMETVNSHLQEKRQSESDSNLGQMLNLAGKNIKKKKVTVNIFKKLTENMLEEWFFKFASNN